MIIDPNIQVNKDKDGMYTVYINCKFTSHGQALTLVTNTTDYIKKLLDAQKQEPRS